MTAVSEKLKSLRALMKEKSVDYYYVPTRDDHNNEYVPSNWQRREWLSGFTGSYGEALVGMDNAFLWTDPRYFLQAEQELDNKQFQLMKQLQGVTAPVSTWLRDNVFKATVAADPRIMSIGQYRQWSASLASVQSKLIPIDDNLIDHIWKDRPVPTFNNINLLDVKYTGLSASDKLRQIRDAMTKNGADVLVVSQLDEIAWAFNIRGTDIPFNPLVISYAIITLTDAFLFAQPHCVTETDLSYFAEHKITVQPYDQFQACLQQLDGSVWVDPATVSWWIALQLDHQSLIEKQSPIVGMKTIKNKTELAGAREAHRIDAIAEVEFLHWLENHWKEGVDEIAAADRLEAFRRSDERCLDLSFSTICGFADHGAIVHYHATDEVKHTITDRDMLLLDSGGQYREGTTDITRTIHLGNPTAEQKKHYTLVLKGHLALRHTPFPDGACGEHVNTIARIPLWLEGMDFGHGTGHGVGAYLCVHEGPQRIAYGSTQVPLKPGMLVSNEPGLYFTGKYGIRIENVCEIVEEIPAKKSLTGNGPFYSMRDLTMVPYARKLIDKDLLSEQEIEWINAYHRDINDLLTKDLSQGASAWLAAETKPL